MENDKNDPNGEPLKPRGRTAISIQHQNISAAQEEKRLNNKISEMYGVDSEEAVDIHVNYHIDRISASLLKEPGKTVCLSRCFLRG